MLKVKERERRRWGEGGRRKGRKSLYDRLGNEGEQEVKGSSCGGKKGGGHRGFTV